MSQRTQSTASPTTKGDAREAAILDAVEQLLAERSFAAIQIAQIAERAGVTRPGFYFYFPTKAAAVGALLTEVSDELLDAASAWYEGGGDPSVRLRTGVRETVAVWQRHAHLFTGMLDAIGTDRDAATLWQSLFDDFRDRVARRIDTDADDELRAAGPAAITHLATALTAAAFALMEREVRTFLINGTGQPDTEDAMVLAYLRAIYGRSA